MKDWKAHGAVAVATAIGVLALASTAPATMVTDSGGGTTPTIHAVQEGSHIEMHNSIWNIKCNATLEGTVMTHGSAQTVSGPLSVLTITNCTEGWVFDVVAKGSLVIHYKEVGGGTHGVGTLTSTEATVTATHTPTGLSCGYRTTNTSLGTLTGGNPATLNIEASIPRHAGSFLCGGSTTAWTGSFVTTNTLKIDP